MDIPRRGIVASLLLILLLGIEYYRVIIIIPLLKIINYLRMYPEIDCKRVREVAKYILQLNIVIRITDLMI